MPDEREELREILQSMDVPLMRRELRAQDIAWLRRNLHINNEHHPMLSRASSLLRRLST